MEISDYLRVLRTRWVLVVAFTAVVGVAALIVSLLTTPVYQSTARLFVSIAGTETANEQYQAGMASQQKVTSYVRLLTGETIAQRAIEATGVDLTPAELAEKIEAVTQPDTVLIDVTVSDPSPTVARDLATAVSDQFVQFSSEIEGGSANTRDAPVTVVVVEPAQVADAPVSPNIPRNIVLGLVIGLLLGIVAAVLRDRLDRTIKDRELLEEMVGGPVIGVIPFDKSLNDSPTIDFSEATSTSAEALRQMRTNLQFLDVDNPPRVLVITSAVPSEGKSTTAVNLGLALAEAGHSVVVVEGDLRRPRVGKYLGVIGSVGVSTVLVGQARVEEVIQPTSHVGVDAIAAGPIPPNPSELLGSEAARYLIGELRLRYDYVIIDAPPLLPVTDAAVLTVQADGALIVTRFGHAKREEVSRAVESVTKVSGRVLGGLLTMVPAGKGGAYAEYSYYYETDPNAPRMATTPPPAMEVPAEKPVEQPPAQPRTRRAGARRAHDGRAQDGRAQDGTRNGHERHRVQS